MRTSQRRKMTGNRKELGLLNFRVNKRDRRALDKAAERYTEGNLSEWLRLAGTHYKPQGIVIVA